MNTDPIVVEQTYNVPIAVVWQAITDKDQMSQWYFEPMTDFECKVGFETQFDVQCEGQIFPHQWKVTEVVPETRIAYDWRYGGYPGDSSVTWDLSETPDGTNLKLTHRGHETLKTGMSDDSREGCAAGWRYFLHESLKAFLERQES
ncbi:MAG: SRPBCC family protein [Aeoliella sp.]